MRLFKRSDSARQKGPGLVQGKTVVLRQITRPDLKVIRGWLQEPQLRKELVFCRYPLSENAFATWYTGYRKDPSRLIYLAVLKHTGTPIGQIGFNAIGGVHRNGEMHIFIGSPGDRGKGYAQEMMHLFLETAFGPLNLAKVWLKVNDDNLRAIRFYEKLGFVQEGFLNRHEYHEGHFLNKFIYSTFSDSWHRGNSGSGG